MYREEEEVRKETGICVEMTREGCTSKRKY